MKKKALKCANCGSSDFKQLSDDLFECIYCSAKIQNDNSVKEDFDRDLDEAKLRGKVKYIKATIDEKEFYKKAISHLAVNKFSPSDLLEKGKFGFVEYDYYFFAVLDVDFTAMKVSARRDDLVSLLSNQQVNSTIGKYFCVEISDGVENTYMNEVMEQVEDIHQFSHTIASGTGKSGKINLPSQEVIKAKVDECVEDFKKKILLADKASNHVAYKVNKIDLVALPVYTLKFEYGGKKYKLSSSASKLRIIGDFPHNNDLKKEASKKILPFTFISALASIGGAVFAIVHLIIRLLALVKYDLILAGVALATFAISELAYKWKYRKKSKEVYEQKLKSLKKFLKQSEIKLSKKDEEYIHKFLRWF